MPKSSQSSRCTGTIWNVDSKSTLAICAPLPNCSTIQIASSTFTYCNRKSSFEMLSLMLWPAGAERCRIILHRPFFLGTAPRPEQWRLGRGGLQKGPRMPPLAHSFANLSSMAAGCFAADCRLCT